MNIIITLAVTAFVVLYCGLFKAKKAVLPIAIVGLLIALAFNFSAWNSDVSYYNMMKLDQIAIAFGGLTLIGTIGVLLLSTDYFKKDDHIPEYFTILLFALAGIYMMLSYTNLSLLFIGLETMSVSLYILAGIRKTHFSSNEASLKYFLMGAFSTGFLLLGFALIYGATGSFDIQAIHQYIIDSPNSTLSSLMYPGIVLIMIGMCFKIGAAPFHFWTPDVYEGSPTLITTFMATIVKTAGIVAFLRLFEGAFSPLHQFWVPIIIAISFLTIFVGNVTALFQKHFKRMLAYSSISHAGYLLFAFLVLSQDAFSSSLLYLVAYTFASLVAFGALILIKQNIGSDHFESFNGLAKKNPFLSLCLTIAMLSMAGIPLTAGFMGKYLMFINALKEYHFILVIFAVLNALVGFYYYFQVIAAMYFKTSKTETPHIKISTAYLLVFVFSTLVTLILGIYPSLLLNIW